MSQFSEQKLKAVWEKASLINEDIKDIFRMDVYGNMIFWNDYGDATSDFGWEIDHIIPQAELLKRGFSQEEVDIIFNLQPLNWQANREKSDKMPNDDELKFLRCVYKTPGNPIIKLLVQFDKAKFNY